MARRNKHGDKKGTAVQPAKAGNMRGRGQANAQVMSKSTVVKADTKPALTVRDVGKLPQSFLDAHADLFANARFKRPEPDRKERKPERYEHSGGYVQSNWQAAKVYDRRKATDTARDLWNKGTLVRWVKPS